MIGMGIAWATLAAWLFLLVARDGFWLARWLRARGIEAHVIHPASVPVSREHRPAKTDRLDTQQLMRAF